MSSAAVPPPPRPSHTPHLLIFLTVFIDLLGFGIVIPALPLYAEHFGLGAVDNGILLAVYSFMQVICSPIWGMFSDRYGRRPILLISVFGTAVGFVLMGLASPLHSVILLFAARIIDGASGGNISTAQAYLADITPPEKRAKMMGLIGAAFGLGFVFGPLLAGLLGLIHYTVPFYFAGALALANTVFIYLKLPESLPPERRTPSGQKTRLRDVSGRMREVIRCGGPQLVRTMVVYFLVITAFSLMTARFSLNTEHQLKWIKSLSMAQFVNGMLLGLVGIVGAIIQGRYIGRLSAKFGEKRLALVGAAVLAVFLFLLEGRDALWSLAFVSIGIAIGNSLATPTLNSIASRGADAQMQGRAMGLMASAGSVGRVVGPLLSGPLAHFNLKPFWWAAAIMVAAVIGIAQLKPKDAVAAPPEADPVI